MPQEKMTPQEIVLQDQIMPQEKISQVLDVPSANSPEPMAKNSALVSDVVEPKGASSASAKSPGKTEKPISNLELLEKKEFQLTLSGTYHAGSPNAAKSAYLEMKIRPVLGSGLENFKVVETKITLDHSIISVKNPSVSIKGNNVLMTFSSDAVGSFVIKGTLDEPLLSDKNNRQTLVIQNQLFYLTQKNIPYHLDMAGTMSN